MKYRIWDKVKLEYNNKLFLVYTGDIMCVGKLGLRYVDKDNYTVELSTRLLDKNGKEIYEGDIITNPYWWWGPGEVILEKGSVGPCNAETVMQYIIRRISDGGTTHNLWNGKDVEVIGNIHDGLPKE